MPEIVVKIGGGLLADVVRLDTVLAAVAALARTRRTMIVPGGGPFADVVRRADEQLRLPSDTAHWMAVLAMDQYAHLLAARLPRGLVVTTLDGARAAMRSGEVPVLAPSAWLQTADPLPHTWDVTSDSIAAWIAGAAAARHLVLVKPTGATGILVDGYFARALPPGLIPVIVAADRAIDALAQIDGIVKPAFETT